LRGKSKESKARIVRILRSWEIKKIFYSERKMDLNKGHLFFVFLRLFFNMKKIFFSLNLAMTELKMRGFIVHLKAVLIFIVFSQIMGKQVLERDFLMAVPKKKRSKSRQGMIASGKHVSFDQLVACPQCKEPRRPHHLCSGCGYYNNRKVIVTRAEKRRQKSQSEND
jgi:large subunit ribosomal protein L32